MHEYYDDAHPRTPPLSHSGTFVVVAVLLGAIFIYWLIWTQAYHYTDLQVAEFLVYTMLAIAVPGLTIVVLVKRRDWRENQHRYPPLVMEPAKDLKHVQRAWSQGDVVLGYNVHGEPWLWPDKVRVMQGIVLGMTGSGKTTLLENIITQDLSRRVGTPEDPHKIPMVIFDGKGDLEFFYRLLPHIAAAGRLEDLRLINPARPELSCLYNPFHTTDENYMAQVNMVFGSFNLHDEFFAKHQLNYLADIVRILHYTGLAFNFYDVIVMALDEEVLKEQIEKARKRIQADREISSQRRLNFEMSVRNLTQSFEDRERVPKIQGLLNECMTFLDDELSVITGPYEELLSIDDVIEQELILFVTLNVNKNTEPVRALGKMLLQNLQLVVGKRYESEAERRRLNKPIFSVVLDEFAPFGYRNFAQILQTARGTNTAFLFSMQSLPQLLQVGRGFKEDVTSAPNTKISLRTQDEETAKFFIRASAEHTVTKRTVSLRRGELFGWERFEKGATGSEREEREYRADDERIKNLPKGQMQILMTDDTEGTLHRHLHVRPPENVGVSTLDSTLAPRLRPSRADVHGANLRFKNPELVAQFGRRMPGRRSF
jgi:Type IV secretory system Conjugative DNA transfer